jgi:hypothetical protein
MRIRAAVTDRQLAAATETVSQERQLLIAGLRLERRHG